MIKYSIIVISYKSSPNIERVLKYIENSMNENVECIVVNNNDFEDHYYLKLQEAVSHHPKFKLVDTKVAGNAQIARNMGLDASRGEFVKFLDDDDYINEYLFSEIDNIDISDVDVVFGRITHNKKGVKTKVFVNIHQLLMLINNVYGIRINNDILTRLLISLDMRKNPNTLNSVIRRDSLIAAGGWNETMVKSQDAELFIRLSMSDYIFKETKVKFGTYNHDAKSTISNHGGMSTPQEATLVLLNMFEFNLPIFHEKMMWYKFYLFGLPHFKSDYQKGLKNYFNKEKV